MYFPCLVGILHVQCLEGAVIGFSLWSEWGGHPCTFPWVLGNVLHVPSCMSVPNQYMYLPLVSWMHVLSTVNGDLLTEVLPLCGCLTSLKASGSPSLQV